MPFSALPRSPRSRAFIVAQLAVAAAALGSCRSAGPAAAGPGVTHPPVAAESLPGTAEGWRHDDLRGDVFYEIFVRSFADSDGDGVGDLQGLTERLDHLNDGDPAGGHDLGVDGIWLMPIFASPSYHGYDVVDYLAIDPEYGTEEDFDRFLAEAHRRGMRVILDLVVNHTGSGHPWFVESASSPESPRRDWYVWREDDPGWTQPWGGTWPTWHEKNGAFYYGVFWGGMPDLNWRTPAVRDEIGRIAAHWLARGVDGFRLDATRHLVANGPGDLQNDQPETHLYLKELSARVRAADPSAILVGENWTTTAHIAPYFGSVEAVPGGDELPMNFNFPLADGIVKAVASGDATPVTAVLAEMASEYPAGVMDAPFLTNHDQTRIATQLAGDRDRLGTAAAVLLTLPGVPFLYYGEEIGLPNGPGREDEHKRTPMPWTPAPGHGFSTAEPWFPFAPAPEGLDVASQSGDPTSLLSRYRDLLRVRRGSSALRQGHLTVLPTRSSVLAFVRTAADESVLVVHNLGTEATEVATPTPLAKPLFADAGTSAAPGDSELEIPGGGTAIWTLAGD